MLSILNSRKFFVGTISVVAIIAASTLRALDKIPQDALFATVTGLIVVGTAVILGTAWEDSSAKGAGGKDAPPPPAVTVVNQPKSDADNES